MKVGKDTSIIEKNKNNKIPKDGKLKIKVRICQETYFTHDFFFFLMSLTIIQSLIMIFTKVVENPKMDH